MILRNAAARHGRRALAGPISRSTVRNASTDAPTDPPPSPEREPPSSQLSFSPQETSAWAASMLQKAEGKPQDAPPMIRSSRRKQTKYAQDSVMQLSVDGTLQHGGLSWSKPHEMSGQTFSVQEQWNMFKKTRAETQKLGTALEKRYNPGAILNNPPMPEDVTLEMLMAAQTHMGHNTSKWNPANARYIYGVREGTHIISLENNGSAPPSSSACGEEVAYHGGIILFVGTRNGQMEIVSRSAQMAGAYQLFTKWAPGTITNRDVMLDGHTTKVIDENDRHLPNFERYDLKSRPLMPDLVVCLNPQENYTMLYECGLATIPTIGIIDTDTDPTWVTYGIPANDDSLRSVAVIGGVLGRAGQRGQQRRKESSAQGNVPWQTTAELKKHIASERAQVQAQRKRLKEVLAHTQGLDQEEIDTMNQQDNSANVVDEVNEDAMLSIMGQAATGKKGKLSPQNAALTFENRTNSVARHLDIQLAEVQQLAADIEAATLIAVPEALTAAAQKMSAAQELKTDIKTTDEDVTAPKESLAQKKRRELEALLSGKPKAKTEAKAKTKSKRKP